MLKPLLLARKSLEAMSMLWLGSLAGAGLALLTQIIVARELTPADYGTFVASLAAVTTIAPLAGFGHQAFLLKTFGRDGWDAHSWIAPSLKFIAVTTAMAIAMLAAWATWGSQSLETRTILYLLMPIVLGSVISDLVVVKLQLEEKHRALVGWQLLPNAGRFLVVVVVTFGVTTQPTAKEIAGSYSAIAFLLALLALPAVTSLAKGRLALRGFGPIPLAKEADQVAPTRGAFMVARQAWPFGLDSIVYMVYFQIAVILLGHLNSAHAAGVYAVGVTILSATYLLPSTIYQKYLIPKFHRWANHDPNMFLQAYRLGNGYMLLLGILIAMAMALAAPRLVVMLFGSKYDAAIPLLSSLALCVPARFLVTSIGSALVTKNNMRRKVFYMSIAAVINVFTNLLLLPTWGATGAVAATLVGEYTLLALFLIGVRKHVFGRAAWQGWTLNPNNCLVQSK